MSRKKSDAAPVETPAAAPVELRAYRINLGRTLDNGRRQAHPWLPWTVVVEGCESEADARRKFLAGVEGSIVQVEAEGK